MTQSDQTPETAARQELANYDIFESISDKSMFDIVQWKDDMSRVERLEKGTDNVFRRPSTGQRWVAVVRATPEELATLRVYQRPKCLNHQNPVIRQMARYAEGK